VAWARMLLAKPKLALLDESTSALDAETEEFLYEQLEDSGVTYVSVGHRPSLKPFHKQKLSIFGAFSGAGGGTVGEGSWELKPVVPPVYRMM